MSVTGFTPKGDIAEWRMVYEHLVPLGPGTIVTYEEFAEILDRDLEEGSGRAPIYRASAELEEANFKTLVNVRGVGYRVSHAREHVDLAKGHHKRAKKQIKKAVSKITSANRGDLNQEELQTLDGHGAILLRHQAAIRSLTLRQDRLERAQRDAAAREAIKAQADESHRNHLEERLKTVEETIEQRLRRVTPRGQQPETPEA